MLHVESEDGNAHDIAVEAFFATGEDLPALEAYALELCRGHVLDVGAGTGRHAILLAEDGARVTALDVLPDAVAFARARGLDDVREGDVFDLEGERFDTLLLLMNGIGITGTLAGLDRFLAHAHTLLRPGGQILLDSMDALASPVEATRVAAEGRRASGRFPGEVVFRLTYGDLAGEPYPWLFLDAETLRARARERGWHAHVVYEDDEACYLARLTPLGG